MPNKKYVANKKNGGVIPPVSDKRVLMVATGCQECIECRKQKAKSWNVRLQEDIRRNRNGKFVTFTFSDEEYIKCRDKVLAVKYSEGYDLENNIAKYAMRHFLEKCRKKNKKSLRHWMVTELGQESTENIHLHGIIWTDDVELIKEKWNYGHVFIGTHVSEQTVNYIVKYVNKCDEKHRYYKSKVLTSAGIGKGYELSHNGKMNTYKEGKTNEAYVTRTGHKMALPTYYRNKIYSEKEREALWIEKLNKNVRYVLGVKCIDDYDYAGGLRAAQKKNKELGFGDGQINWDMREYEIKRRELMAEQRRRRFRAKHISEKEYKEKMFGFEVIDDCFEF